MNNLTKNIMNFALLLWSWGILAFVWLVWQGRVDLTHVWNYLKSLGG